MFYTDIWLLFCPENALVLLLVGHLLWLVKSFGPSLKLTCKGLHSFGLCKCCFPNRVSQLSASFSHSRWFILVWAWEGCLLLCQTAAGGGPSCLLIWGYWYLLKKYGILSFLLGTVKKSAFLKEKNEREKEREMKPGTKIAEPACGIFRTNR